MKIQNLLIEGFGKISKMKLNLGADLNVIYGMLYGFLQPRYQRRKYEVAYEKYRPWQSDQKYSGELVYTLTSGQRYRVKRDFNLDTVVVNDENTWQDLTNDFPVCLKAC